MLYYSISGIIDQPIFQLKVAILCGFFATQVVVFTPQILTEFPLFLRPLIALHLDIQLVPCSCSSLHTHAPTAQSRPLFLDTT
jgi:hypothetical protein